MSDATAPRGPGGTSLHWFRSDLRVADNPALHFAASQGPLACLFVFDPRLVDGPGRSAPRLRFLLDCLRALETRLHEHGHRLIVRSGSPEVEVERVALESGAKHVTWNRDYTPFARQRDVEVECRLREHGIAVTQYKDHVVFDASEVGSCQNRDVAVYSPYKKAWQSRFEAEGIAASNACSPLSGDHAIAAAEAPERAPWGLIVRTPSIGGAENAACLSYPRYPLDRG